MDEQQATQPAVAVADRTVNGDVLAEAMRRIAPFMASNDSRKHLCGIYVEAFPDHTELSALDGFRMGHVTLPGLILTEGCYIVSAAGVKDFSQRHYNGKALPYDLTDTQLVIDDVELDLVDAEFPNYRALIPDNREETEVMISPKAWIKAIRAEKDTTYVGLNLTCRGCQMYFENDKEETVSVVEVPVQTFLGKDKKVVVRPEHLRKALTSCHEDCALKVGDPAKAIFFEGKDYWHMMMPVQRLFPRELTLTKEQKDLLRMFVESAEAALKGEVYAKVVSGAGAFFVELKESGPNEFVFEKPVLAIPAAPPSEIAKEFEAAQERIG